MTAAPADPLDRSMPFGRANVLALGVMLPIAVVVFLPFMPFLRADGLAALAHGWDVILSPIVFFPMLLVTIVVHEGLHGAAVLAGGMPRASLRFGFHARTLTPFATCTRPMPVNTYRLVAAMPALVLGVGPMLVSWVTGNGPLAVFAFFMLAFAGGDMLILWLLRDTPPHWYVIDHPERVGCRLVADASAEEVNA